MEGMQPDECTPEVSWRVVYKNPTVSGEPREVVFRSQGKAMDLANFHRSNGFPTKLYRVESIEVDF